MASGQPNLSKEALQALEFVRRQGEHLVYRATGKGNLV